MKKLYLVLMVISLFSISCSKNISDDTSEIMEYDKLFSKYGWENVEKCERQVSSQKFEAITSFEELEKVLKYIQNMQSENIRTLVSEQFDHVTSFKVN